MPSSLALPPVPVPAHLGGQPTGCLVFLTLIAAWHAGLLEGQRLVRETAKLSAFEPPKPAAPE